MRDTDRDTEEEKHRDKQGERGGKQRDHAYVSHIPIQIGEKFWGGSQEALTLER